MKILHVHDKQQAAGGVRTYLRELVAALRHEGHETAVVRLQRGVKGIRREDGEDLVRSSVGPVSSAIAFRGLEDVIHAERPDLVHLHSVFTTMGPAAVRRLSRLLPTVLTLHDIHPLYCWGLKVPSDGLASGEMRRLVHRFTRGPAATLASRIKQASAWPLRRLLAREYRRLDIILVANSYFREELLARRFDPRKLRFIPLFTSRGPGNSRGREAGEGTGRSDPPVILFVGRLSEEKGIRSFIGMLDSIRDSRWCAEIVGEGPEEEGARRLVDALGMEGRVFFRGPVAFDELDPYYRRCRVVVVPSLIPENFGLVGLESLAFAKPVVAFRVSGITEWLRDGINGFLVEPSDLQAMGNRVRRVLESGQLAAELGRNGARIVRTEFTRERHIAVLLSAYEDALRGRVGRV
ncbi:MAG: hypothetical protein AUG09_01185 [Acidobacteria bacterium 13_1_20CM_2_68_7]|nr:MAG: hypothetical protein AUG09_01185 [Acidobacteria bacterium 13_1_20CM_2_68_7]